MIENEENRAVRNFKEEAPDEQQYMPSTSGSGMQIITHIPHLVLNAHPGLHMMAFKFHTVTVARL